MPSNNTTNPPLSGAVVKDDPGFWRELSIEFKRKNPKASMHQIWWILENHEHEPYLALENIDHTKTKAPSPQTNGICERFQRTIMNEFYQAAFLKEVYTSLEELQADTGGWVRHYDEERPHSGNYCYGKTPTPTFADWLIALT